MAESANSWILEDRENTWFGCLTGVVRRVQNRTCKLREEYTGLTVKSVPWVQAQVTKTIVFARKRRIAKVTGTLFEVMRESSRTNAVVELSDRTCSCGFWGEFHYPCVHACAAILSLRKDPLDFISEYYSTQKLHEVFKPFATPVDVAPVVSNGALPPDISKRRGRPKKIRIRNRSEYVNDDSPYHCGGCGGLGHNKRTCKRRADQKKARPATQAA